MKDSTATTHTSDLATMIALPFADFTRRVLNMQLMAVITGNHRRLAMGKDSYHEHAVVMPAHRAGEGRSANIAEPKQATAEIMSDSERNYISIKSWMLMIVVTAIPVVVQLMVLVWAFTGENDSRKNYFRVILAWMVIAVTVVVAMALLAGPASPPLKYPPPWLHKG